MSIVLNGSTGITTPDITAGSYNQGQLAGFRNKIINGNFSINQRWYTSGSTPTSSGHTFDRWKVTGTGGHTFSIVSGKCTVTIPAGNTLHQVIEGNNLQSGNYVLSWEGTAQGRIGTGSYGTSGNVSATIVGGTNTKIEFGPGTLANVQFELNEVSPFENRFFGLELLLCQRYYHSTYLYGTTPGVATTTGALFTSVTGSGNYVTLLWVFPVEMYASPSTSLVSPLNGALGYVARDEANVPGIVSSAGTKRAVIMINNNLSTADQFLSVHAAAVSEIS